MNRFKSDVPVRKMSETIRKSLPDCKLIMIDGEMEFAAGSAHSYHSYDDQKFVFSRLLAVRVACDKADQWHKGGVVIGNDERVIPRWHVNQLRHSRATDVRKAYGLEAVQAVLGHARLETSQIYAQRLRETAARVAAEVG